MACELPGSAHAERRHTFRTEAANRVVPITAVDVIVAGGEPVGGSEKCPSSSVHRRGHGPSLSLSKLCARRLDYCSRLSPTQPCCRLILATTATGTVLWCCDKAGGSRVACSHLGDRHLRELYRSAKRCIAPGHDTSQHEKLAARCARLEAARGFVEIVS
jgi:hypothetical protein